MTSSGYRVIVVWLLCFSCVVAPDSLKNFAWLSDFHIDEYYGTSNSFRPSQCTPQNLFKYKCDGSLSLVRTAVQGAVGLAATAEFIIVTGDQCRHGVESITGVNHTEVPASANQLAIGFLKESFPTKYPSKVLFVLGNDDMFPNYALDITSQLPPNETYTVPNSYLVLMARAYGELLQPEEKRTFEHGGYYQRKVSDTLTLIILNTVMYSMNSPETSVPDPLGQFAWLESVLDDLVAKNETCWLLGHIPPAIGAYDYTAAIHEQYVRRYNNITVRYGTVIRMHLFAHFHRDEFRTFAGLTPQQSEQFAPILIQPSVSPIFNNNPALRIVQYRDTTNTLWDWSMYYLPLNWDNNQSTQPQVVACDVQQQKQCMEDSLPTCTAPTMAQALSCECLEKNYQCLQNQNGCYNFMEKKTCCELQATTCPQLQCGDCATGGLDLCDKGQFDSCVGSSWYSTCQSDNTTNFDCNCAKDMFRCFKAQTNCWTTDLEKACNVISTSTPSCAVQCGTADGVASTNTTTEESQEESGALPFRWTLLYQASTNYGIPAGGFSNARMQQFANELATNTTLWEKYKDHYGTHHYSDHLEQDPYRCCLLTTTLADFHHCTSQNSGGLMSFMHGGGLSWYHWVFAGALVFGVTAALIGFFVRRTKTGPRRRYANLERRAKEREMGEEEAADLHWRPDS